MVNSVDLKSIETLRANFRQHVGKNRKNLFVNKQTNINFVFNRLSINKIGCIKSIKNSIYNGFTSEEHFEAAENIKELFENARITIGGGSKNNARIEMTYYFRCKITENVSARMSVTLWGNKSEGYIDMYLSKDGE